MRSGSGSDPVTHRPSAKHRWDPARSNTGIGYSRQGQGPAVDFGFPLRLLRLRIERELQDRVGCQPSATLRSCVAKSDRGARHHARDLLAATVRRFQRPERQPRTQCWQARVACQPNASSRLGLAKSDKEGRHSRRCLSLAAGGHFPVRSQSLRNCAQDSVAYRPNASVHSGVAKSDKGAHHPGRDLLPAVDCHFPSPLRP
jgi:hypothetical protein